MDLFEAIHLRVCDCVKCAVGNITDMFELRQCDDATIRIEIKPPLCMVLVGTHGYPLRTIADKSL